MFASKSLLTLLTTLLLGAATVQAQGTGCLIENPGSSGYNGGKCAGGKVNCGEAGGPAVYCCNLCGR
ncbi:hypothetical protein HYFRA_00010919 [Hymenoscyphus fraxineus]|uniref:Uncharacterized protein n=1 Tax=Hymenoscyphus fraxineus TaxID=746836 RepID=A0A9N9PTX5_9HELO|nr:hypothetical protein HYFRA_00010919 [Hymenoscyphus fraxineus]